MSVIHSTRPASTDEIAAEMDRRGKVIERLEAEVDRMALKMMNQGLRLQSADGNRAIMKRRLDETRRQRDRVLIAGKHIALKLVEVYRAAGHDPAGCQAIRDFMDVLRSEKGAG